MIAGANGAKFPIVTHKGNTTHVDITALGSSRATRLPKKHEKFAIEFIKTRNATQSAITAGFAPSRADQAGYSLLRDPKIRKFIDDEIELALGAERPLYRKDLIKFLKDMSSACIHEAINDDGSIKPPSQWSDRVKAAVSEYSVLDTPNGRLSKIKFWDRHKSIILTAKLLDINPIQILEDPTKQDTTMVNGLTADQIDDNIVSGLSQEKILQLQEQRLQEEEARIQATYEPGGVNNSIPPNPEQFSGTILPTPTQATSHLLRKIGPRSDSPELNELEIDAQTLRDYENEQGEDS